MTSTIMNEAVYNIYSVPQSGGSLPVFSGSKRHLVGGGFFGTLARFALPLLKTIGKRALGAASRGATQYLSGNKSFVNAMTDEMGAEAVGLAKEGVSRLAKRRRGQRGPVLAKRRKGQHGSGMTTLRKKSINKTIFDR